MASSSVTPSRWSRAGSTFTLSSCLRWPQIATFATPGTPSSRARMFQYAVMDRSSGASSSEDSPIFMIRLVADLGWMMTGGAAQLGNVEVIELTRSWTSCRASMRSVPGSKISSIDESWVTDLERITSSSGTPCRFCSSGTVISSSTSEADRPMQAVCTSTRGGANSGKTSTEVPRTWLPPSTSSARAAATARKRYLRLVRTIQRIICPAPSGDQFRRGAWVRDDAAMSVPDPELGAPQLGRPHDRDAGTRARSLAEGHGAVGDAADGDRGTLEHQRLG